MIYGALLAGGSGTRIKSSSIPKQFIMMNGKPIIIYAMEHMLVVSRFDYLYVAVHKDYYDYMQEMVEQYIPQRDKVRIILGGEQRIDTIHNVTDAIEGENGISEDDVIIIHDSVRPFVTEKILNDSIDAAMKYGAVVTALPASDTIIHSLDGELVSGIPDRATVYQGQAPDSYNLKLLIELENKLTEEQKKVITGTSQICTFNNKPLHMIEGDTMNFKITTDSDLMIVKNILER